LVSIASGRYHGQKANRFSSQIGSPASLRCRGVRSEITAPRNPTILPISIGRGRGKRRLFIGRYVLVQETILRLTRQNSALMWRPLRQLDSHDTLGDPTRASAGTSSSAGRADPVTKNYGPGCGWPRDYGQQNIAAVGASEAVFGARYALAHGVT